jgi:iron complex outermembrane receptor protein
MFTRTKVCSGVLLALSGAAILTGVPAFAQSSDRVEITGSRLKRTTTEGSLPVTVIDRAAIEASGQTSVAELMRDVTFASFGNTKPQSGSSAQALSDVDLRGLGSNRTLVLIDGRRISKAPFQGQSQDLNSVPLAAVERIEILSDGASAVYGSDAIGGVVNIITRKNFNGIQLNYGEGDPSVTGGNTKEMSLLWGASGTKGRMFAGMSVNRRGMIFTRDQPGGDVLGVSSFGNNYQKVSNVTGNGTGARAAVPGFACNTDNFWQTAPNTPSNLCSFNFNAIAANEASIGNKSIFANGDFNITDDWSIYTAGSIANVNSFGRYAPTPVDVALVPTSPAYLAITAAVPGLAAASPRGLRLRHRMAAAGPRDSSTDATVTSGMVGVKGRLFNAVDLDVGFRSEKYKYVELGRNYIVRPLLEKAITSGEYDIFNPFANSADVLNGVKSTISRDDIWDSKEYYATASMDLFKIGNRAVTGLIGFEGRKEYYQDNYDPQQEAGIIEGSAGNSAAGSRKVQSAFFEMALPLMQNLEITFAGRQDHYNDAGNKFSPKVAIKFQPMKTLTLRSSVGEGFRAPTLDVLTQKPSFSADTVTDLRTCKALGRTAAQCGDANNDGIAEGVQPGLQIDATVIANPALKPETSKQGSFGIVWDATDWLNLSLDFYSVKIDGRITNTTSQTVINRTLAGTPIPGLSVTRDPVTGAITNVTRGAVNEGTLDTNGFDLNVRTDFKLGTFGRLQNQVQYSSVEKYTLNGGSNLVSTQGVPKYRINVGNTWTWGALQAYLAINHIAKQPGDPDSEPATKGYTTANIAVTYKLPTKTSLTIGVINFENKKPELLSYDGRPWNFALYDALGRQVYFRVSQAF